MLLNGNFTVNRMAMNSDCSKIYMSFEGKEIYDE
jgi:hypothetical protein